MGLFEQLFRQGNTLIVVTHEEDIARMARRIIRLRDGLVASDERIGDSKIPEQTAGHPGTSPAAGPRSLTPGSSLA
jgi:ABC-type polar amino acid transport system ATPase subunit